ncbi:MAG: hypothetical protein Q7J32_14515 [Sphingomonadaceae bacterium]|nr:hypothetical protein [Sphingomonadaceae bacterium]
MFPRWLLIFALTCGMLFTPLAMAAPMGQTPANAADHCAQSADGDQQAPVKQLRCIGACAAVEVGVPRLEARPAILLSALPLPRLSSPLGVLLERDTPPPRPALS